MTKSLLLFFMIIFLVLIFSDTSKSTTTNYISQNENEREILEIQSTQENDNQKKNAHIDIDKSILEKKPTQENANIILSNNIEEIKKKVSELHDLLQNVKTVDTIQSAKDVNDNPSIVWNDPFVKESYIVGQAIAHRALVDIENMKVATVLLDKESIKKGFIDGLFFKNHFSKIESENIVSSLDKYLEKFNATKREQALKKLVSIASKSNTIEKNLDSVIIRVKKGEITPKENEQVSISFSAKVLDGTEFDSATDIPITYTKRLPPFLYKIIRVAEIKGKVEIYILADKFFEEMKISGNIPPYEIIHYSISIS